MARRGEESAKPPPPGEPQDFRDFFRAPWWDRQVTDPPSIDAVDPWEGEPGSKVLISGRNLLGAHVFFDETPARRLSEDADDALIVAVPHLTGDVRIRAENVFGSGFASDVFHIVAPPAVAPSAFTFRGDALSFGGDPFHSITPTGLGQKYLVLMALPSGGTAPGNAATVQADLISKLGPRPPQPPFPNSTANGFWFEDTYRKVSFDFDIHPDYVPLAKPLSDYSVDAKPKRIVGDGVTYPVTFLAKEDLTLTGDAGYSQPVSFPPGTWTLLQIEGIIRSAIGPGDQPIRAIVSGGQIGLETTRSAADAVLTVSGPAAARLGLTDPPAKVTAGQDSGPKEGFYKSMKDALEARVAGMTNDSAANYLSGYAGLIVAFAGSSSLLRASAVTQAFSIDVQLPEGPGPSYPEGKLQVKLSVIRITTGDSFSVFAHEIGHNLGLPDLYEEPGLPSQGDELGGWDIMADTSDARHTTAWSKAFKSRDPQTGTRWMAPGELAVITPPPAAALDSGRFLLAPLESPLPMSNPFAAAFPNVRLVHAIKLEREPGRSLYVENRQASPYQSTAFGKVDYSRSMPGQGVIVTDAVDTTDGLPAQRREVVLATPFADPLDTPPEQRTVAVLTATNSIEVEVVQEVRESAGSRPVTYLVEYRWGQGPFFDYRIRDWTPPPWESPDIWIDTRVDNGWDEYRNSDAALNPNVLGNPVRNGDRSRVGWPSRVYARIWNDGQIARPNVQVFFEVVVPAAMGPSTGTAIGNTTVNLPPGGSALARVPWTPATANEGHVCIRAMVRNEPGELNANNNMAQENITEWWLPGSPPYDPVSFPFQVTNPLPRRSLVRLQARGLRPGWFLDVDPVEFWLQPDETIEGEATLRADARVPVGDDPDLAPVTVTLEALVLRNDAWVAFGGISGRAHAVHRAHLEIKAARDQGGVLVTGRAWTAADPVRGANVSVRLLARDRSTEVSFGRALTDANGEFSPLLPEGEERDATYVEAVLSPTRITSPADAGPQEIR
jgi:Metallo-peptidase family M12B Reprolysin-like